MVLYSDERDTVSHEDRIYESVKESVSLKIDSSSPRPSQQISLIRYVQYAFVY